jgi:hypothetical protein
VESAENLSAPTVDTAWLWFGVLAGPVAWALDEAVSYAITQHACSTGAFYELHIISVVCLLLAISGVVVSRWQLTRVPEGADDEGGSPRDRGWFLARFGIACSLGFALVIIALAVPKIILSPCD